MVSHKVFRQSVQKLWPKTNFFLDFTSHLKLVATFERIDRPQCNAPFFHSKLNLPAFLFNARIKILKNGDVGFFWINLIQIEFGP